jgi:peptide-methionine (S)-S-oxide reductase
MKKATFANGCFWCTEAVFKRLRGVTGVVSGYTGGRRENPSYDQVSTGVTGHAEAVEVEFDPKVLSYDKLLDVFFATHDPTTLNRQGADVGTQYRSAIFYRDEEQKRIAEEKIKELDASEKYKQKIVTEVVPFTSFYKAEATHQNFYDNNQYYPYCQIIIDPKIKKLYKEFSSDMKEEYFD